MTRSTRDPIRCVCFDWGGVILRHCRSWDEACALTGIPVRGETMDPQRVQARRELNMLYATGRVSCEEFFSRLTHLHDGRYSEQEVRTLHHAWLTTEYEGLGAIISRLNAMGTIETALLSNTCHAHWQRHLAGEGQAPDYPTIALLKHRHASHLLGFAKPDERIYRAFEEQTGFVGAEILFFDDLPDNIRAAGERGWRGVLVDYTKETAPQVIAGLREHGVWEEQSAERG